MKSWIEYSTDNDFSIYNIPFGIAKTESGFAVVTRIGDEVIFLNTLTNAGLIDCDKPNVFTSEFLNDFIKLGKAKTSAIRVKIQQLFSIENASNKAEILTTGAVIHFADVVLSMPVKVGDYTDFYSSMDHAINIGKMLRDPNNALLPNWKHLPVGYHGRSSSIVISGTDVIRPIGQTKPADAEFPFFGPSKLLDFELEVAFITGQGKPMGQRITTAEAHEYIFGMVLFNDWSARDVQGWEYVPLGPFLAKNFASSISPWVVTMEALAPFVTSGPVQEPEVLPYLKYKGNHHYDINLEVAIQTANGVEKTVTNSNYKFMYWNMVQQLAHHTVNGCNINAGDMMASGTISGPSPDSFGSMMEITWRGTQPLTMPDGTERKFINDGDTVVMRGAGIKGDIRVGFGEVIGKVLPAQL